MTGKVAESIGEVGMQALCTQIHRMRDAGRRISEEGLIVADARGNPTPHPAIAIEKGAQAEVRQWLQRFGL